MAGLTLGSLCFLLPLVGVGLIVFAVVRTNRSRQQRMTDLATFAHAREWRFTPDGTGLESRFSGDPFGRGHRRQATNVVEGRFEGRAFLAFDYTYVTSSGEDSTTHRCSVITMRLDARTPMLQVSPQGNVGRFFNRLLGNDFLVGHPAFDKDYLVRTDSPEFARDVLNPAMIALLGPYVDRGWRLQDSELIMFRSGQHVPQEIDAVLAFMKAILDHVPPHVWSRLRGER